MRVDHRSLMGAILATALATTSARAQEPAPEQQEQQEQAKEQEQDGAAPATVQDLKTRTAQAERELSQALFSLSFSETPLYEVQWFLRDIMKTPLLIDATADLEVTISLELEQVPAKKALERIAAAAGLELKVWRGFVVMCRPDRPLPEQLPAEKDPARERVGARLVRLHFDETPLVDVAIFLGEVTGMTVRIPADAEELNVCMGLVDVPMSDVVDALAAITGCIWRTTPTGELEFVRPQ